MNCWPLPALSLCLLCAVSLTRPAAAQEGPPQYVVDAVDAVLQMLDGTDDSVIHAFISEAMVDSMVGDREELVEYLRTVRSEVRGLRDDIGVEADPDGIRLILSSAETERQIKVRLLPEGITGIRILEPDSQINLTPDNLSETFDRLEADGLSGLVYVRLDGEVVFLRPFGAANDELNVPNAANTVFAIGSRPIDFTQAAVYLLYQRGILAPDHTLDRYFESVPEDKRGITIGHLMTGQSGLPDFFHTEDDWDPDLAWIDRETAVRRLMSQSLLFPPGQDRRHSHAAFGLLAAVIERVSGDTYYDFIRNNFLDPAGMSRTGEYGETRGLSLSDFAVGAGPMLAGLPNIPPNWGPTSWLIKGSGGMYSTLGDLLKFYEYVRTGGVLDEEHGRAFRQAVVSADGSDQGFELLSGYFPPGNEFYLFINSFPDRGTVRKLSRGLERLTASQP